ncbi:hypothetical protein D3C78_963380 [compost metagenome]
MVIWIVVGHHRSGVESFLRRRSVSELPIFNLTTAVGTYRGDIHRHVCGSNHLLTIPVQHPVEDAHDISQHLPSFTARLDIDVTGMARLNSTRPIRHHHIAVLGNLVQRPFVDHRWCDPGSQTKPLIGYDIVKHPRRVICPCPLETTVPDAGVCSCLWVVVSGNLYIAAFSLQ